MSIEITPQMAARVAVILRDSYSTATIAQIAAGCEGTDPHERVLEALHLLQAAEEIACPNPHVGPQEAEDAIRDDERFAREEMARKVITAATDKRGKILRKELCLEACRATGLGASQTNAERYFDDWLKSAACEVAGWELARSLSPNGLTDDDLKSEVVKRRSQISSTQLKAETEELRLSLESGQTTQKRVVRDEAAAKALLLGDGRDFTGLLQFLKTKLSLPVRHKLPRVRDPQGQYAEKRRGHDGCFEGNAPR